MAEPTRQSAAFDSGKEYLGTVYAKALLGVTELAGNTSQVLEEFGALITDVLDKLPQFDATLSSLRVSHEEKARMLDKALKAKISETLLNFLKVVSKHGRLDCLRSIFRAMRGLVDTLRGRVSVEISTATAVAPDVLKQVEARLRQATGREVDLRTRINAEILGGIIVRVGDTVYDGSVRNQLQRLREETLDTTLQKLRDSADRFVVVG